MEFLTTTGKTISNSRIEFAQAYYSHTNREWLVQVNLTLSDAGKVRRLADGYVRYLEQTFSSFEEAESYIEEFLHDRTS